MLLADTWVEWFDAVGVFINRVGFPATVAATLALGIWYTMQWFRPWGERLVTAHIEFTQALCETQKKQATTQSDTLRVLDEMQGVHKSSRKALGHLAEGVVEAAPEDRRDRVRQHIQKAHEALNDD